MNRFGLETEGRPVSWYTQDSEPVLVPEIEPRFTQENSGPPEPHQAQDHALSGEEFTQDSSPPGVSAVLENAGQNIDWTRPLLLTTHSAYRLEDGCFAELEDAMGNSTQVVTVKGVDGELAFHAPGCFKWTPDAGTQVDGSPPPDTHESVYSDLESGTDSDRTVTPDPMDQRNASYYEACVAREESHKRKTSTTPVRKTEEEHHCTQGGEENLRDELIHFHNQSAKRHKASPVLDCCL